MREKTLGTFIQDSFEILIRPSILIDEELDCITKEGQVCQKMEDDKAEKRCPVCADLIEFDQEFCSLECEHAFKE